MISGLQALITAANLSCASRVYPLTLPDTPTLPAVTYQVASRKSTLTLSTTGAQRTRVQFDCWGARYADADTLRDSLIASLDGFSGALPDGSLVDGIALNQVIDGFEPSLLQYRLMAEFFIFHT